MGANYTVNELAAILSIAEPGESRRFDGVSIDTRTIEAGQVFFALKGEHHDGHRFVGEAFARGAVAAVVLDSEARELRNAGPCVAVADTIKALQRFARHHRSTFDIPLIAITGSAGKTSTKDLMAGLLASKYRVMKTQENLNNEIGCPLSLLQLDSKVDVAVVEMGANHIGEIGALCELARPSEAAITLIAASHLEGFGSLEGVAAAKGEIVESLPEDGIFYVNADDANCVTIAEAYKGRKVYYGTRGASLYEALDVSLEECTIVGPGEVALKVEPVGQLVLPLHSRAHVTNVLPAIAAGLEHGLSSFQDPLREACEKLSRFRVFAVRGVEIIDDTYNANPVSVNASLDALRDRPVTGKRIAVLGDMLELGAEARRHHREVGERVAASGVEHLFARGQHACDTIDAALASGVSDARAIESHEEMAEAIREIARPGDVVLVKGSRGMTMEKVVDRLSELLEVGCETEEVRARPAS